MNWIETLKNEIGGSTIAPLGQKLNIHEDQVQAGINQTIPAVLASLLKKAAGSGTLGSLSSIFTGNTIAVTTDPESELMDEHSLLERGKSMVGDLFGSDADSLITSIQNTNGLSAEKSSRLLTMSVPLITGHIGQIISKNNWSMPDFIGQLFENKSSIESALPVGIASTLGIGSLNLPHINPSEINVDEIETPRLDISMTEPVVPSEVLPSKSSSGSVLKWIIIIALLLLAAWWFMGLKGCNNESAIPNGDTTAINYNRNTD